MATMIFFMSISIFSCQSNGAKKEKELRKIDIECLHSLSTYDFHKSDSLANILLNKANKEKDNYFIGKALYYLGVYNYDKRETPLRLKRLKQSFRIAQHEHDDTLLCRIYNSLGGYEVAYFKRYYMAQQYFSRAMKLGQKIKQKPLEMAAECNASGIYRLLRDTMGIRYEREIFDYAQKEGIKVLSRESAFYCAYYYTSHATNINQLKPYLEFLAQNPKDTSLVNILEAEYYMNHGNLKRAVKLIERVPLKIEDDYENILIIYARILNMQGQYKKSNEILKRAEKKYATEQDDYNWIDIYQLYADNYHALGNDVLAFKFQKHYDTLKDSVSERIHSEQINANRIKYEVDKKDQEIERQQLLLRQQVIVATAIILLLVLIILACYLYARKYQHFARKIVLQRKEAINNEQILREKLDAKNEKNGNAVPTDRKLDDIFEKIRIEMEDKEIYRDTTMTRDTFSELVGCSHTYLTYAIKVKTGMSYTQFINSYRIKKAIEILSDSSNNISPKDLSPRLGFLAVSTFYSVFKKQVGISPMSYRKTALMINEESTKSN